MTETEEQFNRHFDGCHKCKKAFFDNRIFDDLCAEGVELLDASFAMQELTIYPTLTMEQLQKELGWRESKNELTIRSKQRIEAEIARRTLGA